MVGWLSRKDSFSYRRIPASAKKKRPLFYKGGFKFEAYKKILAPKNPRISYFFDYGLFHTENEVKEWKNKR